MCTCSLAVNGHFPNLQPLDVYSLEAVKLPEKPHVMVEDDILWPKACSSWV